MKTEEIFKVLANPMRIQILQWLKEPDKHFPEMIHLPLKEQGKGYVCVSIIQQKANITQSTISHYLGMLNEVDLLSSKRIGKWTYYRRNEERLKELANFISEKL